MIDSKINIMHSRINTNSSSSYRIAAEEMKIYGLQSFFTHRVILTITRTKTKQKKNKNYKQQRPNLVFKNLHLEK